MVSRRRDPGGIWWFVQLHDTSFVSQLHARLIA